MTSNHTLRRRTTLAVAAWTLPVVATATATPAAAASATAAFDLQMQNFSGDNGTWYNDDRTQYLGYNTFLSPTVHNAGPEAAPAGTVVVMRSDDRILGSPSLAVADSSGIPAGAISITGPVVDGDRSTFTAVISVPIPAGVDVVFTPRFGDGLTHEEAAEIHDFTTVFSDLTPHSFSVHSPAGADSDPSNDSLSWTAETGTLVPWNGTVTGEWAVLATGSCTYPYVAAVVVSSTGANAVPPDAQIYYDFDTRALPQVSLASATIDGAPTTMRAGRVDTDSTSGRITWYTTEPVAPGSALRLELATTTDPSAALTDPVTMASASLATDVHESDESDNFIFSRGTCG
ncbi:hypothetical protein C1I63_17275 [Rathayibacter caricis DSM 15933]|uniref:Uncharacterized protein n=1 Tax=Rathayibacter caricis DSM 15933 TaxID=1328867 RepID=A0A2T4UXZ4_9MICO|nr:hypothetical protein [Rathayibacter caricis]PTL74402.1 hypothetical protein C1I63_17275 [Rathayibacter caricis DSM 15933]